LPLVAMSTLALWLAGCSAQEEHTLVSNVPEAVSAGTCAIIEGPYHVPSGATMDYTVDDVDDTDYMDVGIIDDYDSDSCDFSYAHGALLNVASARTGTEELSSGNYDFMVACNNAFQTCEFTLTWTATY
jgi:hypothetical protein